jgi:hypothetical protein
MLSEEELDWLASGFLMRNAVRREGHRLADLCGRNSAPADRKLPNESVLHMGKHVFNLA